MQLVKDINKDKPSLYNRFIGKIDFMKKKLNLDQIDEANSKDEVSMKPS